MSGVEYTTLPLLLKEGTRAMGTVIGLGKKFVLSGIKEMDEKLLPQLRSIVGQDTMPRVLPSYAMLLWFTIEVYMCVHVRYPSNHILCARIIFILFM